LGRGDLHVSGGVFDAPEGVAMSDSCVVDAAVVTVVKICPTCGGPWVGNFSEVAHAKIEADIKDQGKGEGGSKG
jgi:hypothetical protein